jgi:flagellar hook-associated protein 3 FlgL
MLRVSTMHQFRTGEESLVARQRELLAVQQQIASGKRLASPADDPLAAADGAGIRSAVAQFDQFRRNQDHAHYLLNLGESALAGVIDGIHDVREKLVAAGNGALGDGERRMIAGELEGVLARLVGLANADDGAGGFLFGGARSSAAPFAQSGNDVTYLGDEIAQRVEVAQDRLLQVRFSGDALFNKMRPGNGSFTTAAAATNAGSGWIDAGAVTDPAALTGRPYTLSFSVAAGVTTFTVTRHEASGPATTVASGTYSAPLALRFDGLQVNLNGAPADGDSFAIEPAGFRPLFESLAQAISALRQPVAGDAAAGARQRTALAGAQASLAGALDHLLLKRADLGTGLQELDAYGELNQDRKLEAQTRLSRVEDLDIAAAAAELSRRQLSFEAALKSYSMVSRLSLFDFL